MERLLEEKYQNANEDDEYSTPKGPKQTPGTRRQTIAIFALFQIIFVAFYTYIFVQLHPPNLSTSDLYLVSSPAKDAIRYEKRYFEKHGHRTSIYSGPPRPAVEEAWHDLLSGMNIRVSGQYLEPYDASSLPLMDAKGGYAAQLGLYHDLHCLKKIRHWSYKEQYLKNLSPAEMKEHQNHVDHCLEWLRVASLCRGDTTLTTLAWEEGRLVTEYPIPHQCVDSEHLLSWSGDNAVNLSDPDILPRPFN